MPAPEIKPTEAKNPWIPFQTVMPNTAEYTTRMRTCFRKIDAGRDIPDEIASISRKYDAAQRLFNE